MGKLVTDPDEVERLAEEREDENWDFSTARHSCQSRRDRLRYGHSFSLTELVRLYAACQE